MNTALAAVMAMSLETFPNDELAALNNAISWMETLPEENIAFKRAVELSLVEKTGRISGLEELQAAASLEINRRLDAGTFN